MSISQATQDLIHHLASRPGHDEVKADFRQAGYAPLPALGRAIGVYLANGGADARPIRKIADGFLSVGEGRLG
jgi:hypothetical protein